MIIVTKKNIYNCSFLSSLSTDKRRYRLKTVRKHKKDKLLDIIEIEIEYFEEIRKTKVDSYNCFQIERKQLPHFIKNEGFQLKIIEDKKQEFKETEEFHLTQEWTFKINPIIDSKPVEKRNLVRKEIYLNKHFYHKKKG